MKSLLGLVQSAPCRIDLEFKDADGKPYKNTTNIKTKKEDVEEVPVYSNKDTIIGEIRLTPLTTKKLEHQGIKVQLVGQIELAGERGTAHEFVSLARELAPPGDLNSQKVYPFEFKNVELQYDSYKGQQVRCRYMLRVTVTGKGMTQDSRREFNIWVVNYEEPHEAAAPIKMEVGIEDCLHIEFEYDKARYHLKDVVVGRIYFLLVRIKLKHMEIEIRRKETTGAGIGAHSESETLAKYEIMDGAPVRGESVPIRLYLSPYDLAPTYRDIHNKFSVRYFLNLVLVDDEDRRYFKQQEITLYRQAPGFSAIAGNGAGQIPAGPPRLATPARQILSRAASTNGAPAGIGTTVSTSSSGTYQPAVQAVQEQPASQQETPSQTQNTQNPTPASEQLQQQASSTQQPQAADSASQQTGGDAQANVPVGESGDAAPAVKTEGSNSGADLAFGDTEADGTKSPTGIL